jgi:predicted ATPase/class 3 adenylate cyclase
MLHIRLLGPLLVEDDNGNDLTPPGARERTGLASLAVVSPEAISTERLAAELYRERDTADPRNAVQAMVSRLRRSLGRAAGSIETTTSGYRLVDASLDLDEAETLLRSCLAADDVDEAETALEQARALWHGPTLDGIGGESIEAERLRIDDLRADAEDHVLNQRMVAPWAGAGAEAGAGLVDALEQAVRDQPLREARWELLMLALYRSGRQADALRAYQRARSLLSNHLGLEPGPALTRLESRILAHDPTLEADQSMQPPAGDPAPAAVGTASPTGSAGSVGPVGLPDGTVSVLLCDVEGSVRRWESAPVDTERQIETLHRRWSQAIDDAGGHLVKSTGDGVLAVFATAGAAVRAAATAMRDQATSDLVVRAAIHTGPLSPTADGDYRGPAVNRCARLLDLANGGQILVTGTAAELASGELPLDDPAADAERVDLRPLGNHRLRDVADPVAVHQVGGPGLPSSFPPLKSTAAVRLPRPRAQLLGRDDLLDEIAERVEEHRLVTLLGPGGIGKTSLATAAAWRAAGHRPLAFVDLAQVRDPAAVTERMAEAVIGPERDGGLNADRDPMDRLIDRFQHSTDLVVVDNAEHLLDAVSSVVDAALGHDIKASFLVTSRNPLGLPDEVIVGVPPLELPPDGADLQATGRSSSVQLFVERARAVRPDFELADGLLPVVAHICRRLDGIPLAIELAAGRASMLAVDDIAALLDDQIRLLRQVRSGRDRRHRSLEAVVRWSVDQLSPPAREAFNRLAVMPGDFGLDGAGRLFVHCGLEAVDALEVIDELHGASLLAVADGGSRFRMLEPIRQAAMAELVERGLEIETRRAHCLWVGELMVESHRRRDETRAVLKTKVDTEAQHVRAALLWMAESEQLDLAIDMAFESSWWLLTTEATDGERLLARLLALVDRDDDPTGWAKLVLAVAVVSAAGPDAPVDHLIADAIAIFDEIDHPDRDQARLAAAFSRASTITDLEPIVQLLTEAEALVDPDDRFTMALIDMAVMSLTSLAIQLDPDGSDVDEALTRGWRAIEEMTALDQRWALGVTLGQQGLLLSSLGRIEQAEDCYRRSIELFEGPEHYHGTHYIYSELGRLASRRGAHDDAIVHHGAAVRLAEADGSPACLAGAVAGLGHAAEARGDASQALEHYRRAIGLSSRSSLMEHHYDDWLAAISRLEAAIDGP